MVYGYARVSTKEQKNGYGLDVQKKEILAKYPHAIIYEESYTGTQLKRPVFTQVLNLLKDGDMLVVSKVDRFARNTVEGISTMQELLDKGVSVHILNMGLIEDSPMGRFLLTMMLAVAEFERNLIVERTQAGKKLALEKGLCKDGRPPKWSKEQIEYALELKKTHSYAEVVELTGISKSSLMRFVRESKVS
jgi:DNA invertase Pin-like site-specific DNA recombinase